MLCEKHVSGIIGCFQLRGQLYGYAPRCTSTCFSRDCILPRTMVFMRYILANELFNLTTNQRILYFCVSSLVGALLIFVALIYMVLKGNADKK